MPVPSIPDRDSRIHKYARRLKRSKMPSVVSEEGRQVIEIKCYQKALTRVQQEEIFFKGIYLAFRSRCNHDIVATALVDRLMQFRFSEQGLSEFAAGVSHWPSKMTEDELEVELHEGITPSNAYWKCLNDDEKNKVAGAFERQGAVLNQRWTWIQRKKKHREDGDSTLRPS